MGALTRSQILERLHDQIDQGHAILLASAGNGLMARSEEAGGIDLILGAITGISRQRGMPSVGYGRGQGNKLVRELAEQLTNVVSDTPLIAQVDAGEEPADADLGALIDGLIEAGYSGLMDHPLGGGRRRGGAEQAVSREAQEARRKLLDPAATPDATEFQRRNAQALESLREYTAQRDREGRGYHRELELVRLAHERDIFTIAVVWSGEQAAEVVEAGADAIAGHCGNTAGGAVGASVTPHEQAAQVLQSQFDAAKQVRSDVILFGHGGPFATPEDTQRMYELTDAVGFLAGSAVERTAVEIAVAQAVREFRAPIQRKAAAR